MMESVVVTILDDIGAGPEATVIAPYWVWNSNLQEWTEARDFILRNGFVEVRGVRYELEDIRRQEVAEAIAAGTYDPEEADGMIRRRSDLYVLSEKGKQWLEPRRGLILVRRESKAYKKVRRPQYWNALMAYPRDVFDLGEMPLQVKMPECDKITRARVTRFLNKRKAERLSKDKGVDWIPLDWGSPTAASCRPEEASTASC